MACMLTFVFRGPIVVYILENVLVLLMSQAARALRDTSLSNRQKQYLKRELSAEMVLVLH